MSEWDERFARLQGLFKECINQAVPKGDPLGFAEPSEWMIIRGFRDLARESRAQLAQRERELEALRGIRDLARVAIEAEDAAMQHPITEGKVRASMNATAALRAALSDNPDNQELPEDSTCKWPHGYLDPRLGRCPNCSHPINDVPDRPDNTDSPALTDKEA